MKYTMFILIFLFFPYMAKTEVLNTIECSYSTTDSHAEQSQLQPRGNCAFIQNRKIYILDSTLKKLQFSEKGLSNVYTNKYGWLFVLKDGSTIPTITFDNGPDYFVENMARYTNNGKIGFIDDHGNIVIHADYDFALPFRNGYSIVCNGCTALPDGGHYVLTGGTWGCIDKNGIIILPLQFQRNSIFKEVEKL